MTAAAPMSTIFPQWDPDFMFPLWLLQFLVIGGLLLTCVGIVALVVFLVLDSRDKQIW